MTEAEESAWVQDLLDEARRDLVFLLHIANGSFGGPDEMPSSPERFKLMERIIEGLVRGGCKVGFGDADFCVPDELKVAKSELSATLVGLYAQKNQDYEFVTFIIRG